MFNGNPMQNPNMSSNSGMNTQTATPMPNGNQMAMGGNPMEQFAMKLLEEAAPNNPVCANILNMVRNNQVQGIEQVVRNFIGTNGGNYEQLFPQFLSQLGNLMGGKMF